eukprot:PDM74145.1 hypothetical protein PRIPAC_41501 [Pristionchus pacificus]
MAQHGERIEAMTRPKRMRPTTTTMTMMRHLRLLNCERNLMAREEKASLEKLLEDPKKIAFLVNFDLVEKGGHEETVMSHNNL